MGARQTNQLWLLFGVAAVAVLGVLTWFLGVGPQKEDTLAIQGQTQEAELQAVKMRGAITGLRADKANLPALKAALAARQAALPKGSGVPAFLRQLQATGTKVGVDVSGITVADPVQATGAAGVWTLPIQLTAKGDDAQLGNFLRQLQGAGQERAVLIDVVGQSADSENGDETTLSLSLTAFVAPDLGAAAPTTN